MTDPLTTQVYRYTGIWQQLYNDSQQQIEVTPQRLVVVVAMTTTTVSIDRMARMTNVHNERNVQTADE